MRSGAYWPRCGREAPRRPWLAGRLRESQPRLPAGMHDAAVCAVLRYAARNRLSHVDAFDLTVMLGLDTDAALERAQRINGATQP
jgi:hypothetical protein